MMIATHGRNLRGTSNAALYLEAVIYTTPLLYCCEIELSSRRLLVKADVWTSQRHMPFLISSQYLAFATAFSVLSYHEQRTQQEILVCKTSKI